MKWWILKDNNGKQKEIYAAALAAFMSGKEVEISIYSNDGVNEVITELSIGDNPHW